MKTALLIIDDDSARAKELGLLLRFLEETQVAQADSAHWRTYAEQSPDLRCVFLGRYGTQDTPAEAVHAIHTVAPRAFIVLIEDVDQPRHLPTALEIGRIIRLSHPFHYSQLSQILVKSQQNPNRDTRNAQSRRNAELFRSLIGNSPIIARVRELIQRVAPSESTVMILGESGTGKEVIARNIH